jgi:hypothetical protein
MGRFAGGKDSAIGEAFGGIDVVSGSVVVIADAYSSRASLASSLRTAIRHMSVCHHTLQMYGCAVSSCVEASDLFIKKSNSAEPITNNSASQRTTRETKAVQLHSSNYVTSCFL